MVELPDGKKALRMRSAVSAEYRRVTDRQTDGQTFCDNMCNSPHMTAYSIARQYFLTTKLNKKKIFCNPICTGCNVECDVVACGRLFGDCHDLTL